MRLHSKLISILAIALLASCNVQQRVVYFQDAEQNEMIQMAENYEVRIKANDRLKIIVSSKNPELASPFNSSSTYNALAPADKGYSSTNGEQSVLTRTVRPDGTLEMPIIGVVMCEGKTRAELAESIAQQIREGNYIPDPTVNVQFVDMKITVMGEVDDPGQFNIVNDEITILDALALAGDMTIYGERNNVAVIRKVDGKSVIGYLDLRSKEVFASPFYHLQPNDTVYVKPNRSKAANSQVDQNRSFWISLVSTFVSVATLISTIVFYTR